MVLGKALTCKSKHQFTVFLFAVLCCAVLCCAVLCCAVLCCAVLCCAVLCTVLQREHWTTQKHVQLAKVMAEFVSCTSETH